MKSLSRSSGALFLNSVYLGNGHCPQNAPYWNIGPDYRSSHLEFVTLNHTDIEKTRSPENFFNSHAAKHMRDAGPMYAGIAWIGFDARD